jgi:23S rRNA pseudouridine2605 synthase
MHPRFGLEREYAVRVLGALSTRKKQRLLDGVRLDDGRPSSARSRRRRRGLQLWYRVTISEGRNREVRRLFEAVGHAVSRLIRIRYGAMVLPRGLKRGAGWNSTSATSGLIQRPAARPGRSGRGPWPRDGNGGGRNKRRRARAAPRRGPRRRRRAARSARLQAARRRQAAQRGRGGRRRASGRGATASGKGGGTGGRRPRRLGRRSAARSR